jgi:Tfp pilus assembly protein PilF
LGHFNLGVICLRKGDVKRAKKEFEKTIALNPANAIGQRAKDFINQL